MLLEDSLNGNLCEAWTCNFRPKSYQSLPAKMRLVPSLANLHNGTPIGKSADLLNDRSFVSIDLIATSCSSKAAC